ncbi:MAG: hypothetical protein KJP00_03705 [Bacteroidia bacterium]|nr:hypothetical protein [Bacteroidia bacterium]
MLTKIYPAISLFFLWLSISSNAYGQNEKLIHSKKLQKDFKEFTAFLEAHPDPYTHISESEFTLKLKEVEASLDKPHSTLGFYKKISSLVALIRDGHSSVYFPKFWMENKKKELGCFPYELHFTNDNEIYVLKNYNNGIINPSSKIIAINGISVDSFLNVIDPYISYEKQIFRNTIIDDNIDKYLYLAFDQSHDLKIKYVLSDTLVTVVPNMSFKEWKKFQKNDREEKEKQIARGEPYDYKKVKDGIGLIHIYGFFTPDITAYNIFLNKTFKQIKKDSIHSLIIDIRGNYGGWPKIASELFHYISDGYFKTMASSNMKVSYPYKEYFYTRIPALRQNPQLSIPQRRHFLDIGAILNNAAGTFVKEEAFFNEEPIEETYEFSGDVYVLTDRDSYSAASSFASTFQCYSMGIIVGEETGGTKIFRANPIAKLLSKSGIGVRLSTTRLHTACAIEEFQGIIPHIKYSPNILQLVSDIDSHLYYTIRVIREVRKKRERP